jgi:hypothetical protein
VQPAESRVPGHENTATTIRNPGRAQGSTLINYPPSSSPFFVGAYMPIGESAFPLDYSVPVTLSGVSTDPYSFAQYPELVSGLAFGSGSGEQGPAASARGHARQDGY